MPVFAEIILAVTLGGLVLGILYVLISSARLEPKLRRLRSERESIPREQQVTDLQAELTASGRVPGDPKQLGVRVHRYPGLNTAQVLEAAAAVGPWRLTEASDYFWFLRCGDPDPAAPVRRRLGRTARLAVVPYSLAALGVLWITYPYVSGLAVAGVCAVYGLGLFLLLRGDLGARKALVVLLVTLAVGILPAWAAMVSSESYALERSGESVELKVTAVSAPFSTRSGSNTTVTVRGSDGSAAPGSGTFNVKAGSYGVGDSIEVLVDPHGRWAPQVADTVPDPVGVIVTPTMGLLMAFMPIIATSAGRRRRRPALGDSDNSAEAAATPIP